MKQFEQVYLTLLIQRHQRRDLRRAERRITPVYDIPEVIRGYFRGGDVEGEDVEGEIGEAEVREDGGPFGGERGDLFGDEEAAIGCEAFEDDFLKRQLGSYLAREVLWREGIKYVVGAAPAAQIPLRSSV